MHRIGPTAGTAGLAWLYIAFVPLLFNGADYPGIPRLQSWEVQTIYKTINIVIDFYTAKMLGIATTSLTNTKNQLVQGAESNYSAKLPPLAFLLL